ncbi:fumarylacetoacetate hydrolase family protein [Carboxydothermus hydrogenoformans]|uniref:Fumarylacetoacetate hydrolase family protein n=1 Tax=Carboxydothermus hydrogenoformans (strain ATCC BAA-161 / DSM 6008 / Z-2901) TaxID=246194 RepID=Q3AB52_CARHZ|nr:fumarylacetoacetate hydrolase family protein [Carboxydothermus hydrogenoformans]ABB15538.1 fumarylacetoacetate hydrolase family protein [Carboxydothermus hydrogenoformans Z-2901]
MILGRAVIAGQDKYVKINDDKVEILNGDIFGEINSSGKLLPLSEVKLLPPVLPSKIICVGLNYRDHIDEFKHQLPEEPVIFLKPPTAVIGPLDVIILPQESRRVDYEGELAVVIKKEGRNLKEEEARDFILGYTCANDVTARDLQRKDGQWTRGKSFDTFCPLGPWIVTDIEPDHLEIETYLNGELRQKSNTSKMLFHPYFLVSFISKVMTLKPGDVILTGTPSGVGKLAEGDTVEVKISAIGSLRNFVKV